MDKSTSIASGFLESLCLIVVFCVKDCGGSLQPSCLSICWIQSQSWVNLRAGNES
jgi:hypothetical protein